MKRNTYIKPISDPKKLPLKAKVNIHDIIRMCEVCYGSGTRSISDGHDCWGRPEFSKIQCGNCHGEGFVIIDREKIKERLSKIHDIKLENLRLHHEFWGDV